MGYSESISVHTAITSTQNSRHGVQRLCMGNDKGRACRGMAGARNNNVQSRCMRNEEGWRNMHSAQGKACAGGLCVDHPRYCRVAQVCNPVRLLATHHSVAWPLSSRTFSWRDAPAVACLWCSDVGFQGRVRQYLVLRLILEVLSNVGRRDRGRQHLVFQHLGSPLWNVELSAVRARQRAGGCTMNKARPAVIAHTSSPGWTSPHLWWKTALTIALLREGKVTRDGRTVACTYRVSLAAPSARCTPVLRCSQNSSLRLFCLCWSGHV